MVKVSLEPATVYITRPSPGLHLLTGLPSHAEIYLYDEEAINLNRDIRCSESELQHNNPATRYF
jgi:hypothetical protein